MSTSVLWSVIEARAEADTGSGGLFNVASPLVSGIYWQRAPDSAKSASPGRWIVVDLQDAEDYGGGETFGEDYQTFIVRFHIWFPRGAGVGPWSSIADRLRGDYATSGGTITRGFHRYKPADSSPNVFTAFMRQDGVFFEEPDIYHGVETYLVGVTTT